MPRRPAFKTTIFILFCITMFAAIVMRLILDSNIHGSSVLYVGMPMVIAALLLLTTEKLDKPDWKARLGRLSRYSFIIMLASSALLFEGFICVVMFMPIYFGIILLVFIIRRIYERNQEKRHPQIHILPLLLICAALEGTHPNLSFNRYNEVSETKTVNASVMQIKQNLAQPVVFNKERPWFLSLFPMPYQIDAGSLNQGDVHTIHYRFRNWFMSEIHEGYSRLELVEVSERRIRLKIIEDTSYLSRFLKAHGTEINLTPLDLGKTDVKLTIKYDRLLDPFWYFDPLQKYAAGLLGEYLIDVMIVGTLIPNI